jgi:hypothetical protein
MIGLMLVLAACGGGSESDSGSSEFVRLNEYSVEPNAVAPGESFAVKWNASFSSPSSLYVFELHLTHDGAIGSDTRVLNVNCGPLTQPCSNDGSLTCEYQEISSGVRQVACRGGDVALPEKAIFETGTYIVIGRACIFDAKLDYLCDSGSSLSLTLS